MPSRRLSRPTRLLSALAVLLVCTATQAAPRLVLQITIDGLRADLLPRYAGNFGDGGFNYLLREGVVYHNALYLHANTETIVGHTTLATGATPAVHGMVGNVWLHPASGELGYNIEDPDAPLLPTRKTDKEGAQVDPAQLRARTNGRSPRGIRVPTFSDTLAIDSGGRAKVFGISGKDRGAVSMAGKTGTAYWYSTDSGDFQSSRYYMDEYPEWVRDWNGDRRAESLADQQWNLLLDAHRYRHRDRDDRPYEVDLKGYGRTFPHPFGPAQHPLFFTRLLVSPEGDRLLAGFARALVEAEALGSDEVTDYLAVSFSGVDAVNHFFGPSSLENEDVVLQLDRTLASLLGFIDDKIGLEHTLIVLSADHGMADMPEHATASGHPAGRLYSDEVLASARQASEDLYGDAALVRDFFRPYLYLDAGRLASKGLDREAVAAGLASRLQGMPGIADAVPYSSGPARADTAGPSAAVAHNYHPGRSGDVYVFQQPYWFLFDRGAVAAMHGSPWNYDRHVPIIFAGPGIKPARVDRQVHPIDVAPTLSALLGLSPPAGAQGSTLHEVLR